MASSFQRQALNRKLIYAALILVLGIASWAWRVADFSAFGMPITGVDKQATDLAIREQSRGEVDLLGAVVRISTMGFRGLATCLEWSNAMDSQKKNQWDQLEIHVRNLFKLQPHFITPWLFQSWNLSYNVSVENDRVSDKYFFICRGISLLSEGERQNQNNPDIRWTIGFFTQNKIGQSDETNTMRSLSQLSMIPPNERDPGRFWTVKDDRRTVNLKELEDFCKKHPQLVRRLREGMSRERRIDQLRQFRIERPEELIQFLEDNYRVPSLWLEPQPSEAGFWKEAQDPMRPLADRFPALPPRHQAKPKQQPADDTELTAETQLRDENDAFQVARSWYAFAQEPLPKPGKLPGDNEPIENPVYQRMPKHMTAVIFRNYQAQGQRFSSERLLDEGWFDESGWSIPDWFAEQGDRFSDGQSALIGAGRKWSQESWQKALELWRAYGENNHLLLSIQEQDVMDQRSRAFASKFNLMPYSPVPPLRLDTMDAETRDEYFAFVFLQMLERYNTLTNFPYHYNRALVESKDETVRCRKTAFEATALRLKNAEIDALKKYMEPSGLKGWRDKVLLTNKIFRGETLTQEQAFEHQLRFVDLYARLGGRQFKSEAVRMLLLPSVNPPGSGVCPVGLSIWAAPLIEYSKSWDNPLFGGPFDCVDSDKNPLIGEQARKAILQRFFPALFNQAPASDAALVETSQRKP